MGQAPSQPTRKSAALTPTTSAHPSQTTTEKTADPFHRSPISPLLPPTSFPPPSTSKIQGRPSLISLRKSSNNSRIDDPNLPKPTLGARVARKLSVSRQPAAVVRSGSAATPAAQAHPSLPAFGPSSYGRYPNPTVLPNSKLSSSLDSSTLSGPSTSLVTPSASRRNLISPLPSTPLHQIRYSQHHRRGSSTSSGPSPGKAKPAHSPKTRTRAEREWRARVAAISAGTKARDVAGDGVAGGVKAAAGDSPAYKGPVPPRRKGGPQASISAVPAPPIFQSTAINPTSHPPHVLHPAQPFSPPRQSLSSVRSFETLGHHTHTRRPTSLATGSPSHVRFHSIPLADGDPSSPLSHHRAHSRKSSIPQSIGSFYADPNNRGGTRPNSLAASTFLSPLKPRDEVDAAEARAVDDDEGKVDVEAEDGIALGMGAGAMARTRQSKELEEARRDDDLLFDMAIEPSSVPTAPTPPILSHLPILPSTPKPTLSSSAIPTLSRTPTRVEPRRHSAQHTPPPAIGFGQGPETPRSRARKERILSLPSINTSPERTPTRFAIPSQPPSTSTLHLQADTSITTDTTSPSLPSLLSYTLSTPTPTRQSTQAATPTTPYSPMTAYILSAPSIDLTFPTGSVPASPAGWMKGGAGGMERQRQALHPFASVLDAPSPLRQQGGMSENVARRMMKGATLREGECGDRQQENRAPAQQVRALPLIPTSAPRKPLPQPSAPSRPPHPLRPKTPNGLPTSRDTILGAPDRQERTRGKLVLDLTPGQGIGGGARPPKRGMDKSDLEKWLAGMGGA